MVLDPKDQLLLTHLQADSKQTHKELALKLGLSVTAVYERVKKLERQGVIKSYVALLDPKVIGTQLTVFCQIRLKEHSKQQVEGFEKEVAHLEEVLECFHVSGEYDYLLKVLVKDMDHFRKFMVTKLTLLQQIGSTQSSFTISEIKNTTAIALTE